jgi:predicted amidophosphoribosyltransferase
VTAVEQYTDPYLCIYRRVPPAGAGAGVCVVCHSGPNQGYSTCYSCGVTMSQVRYPVAAVLPISLYEVSGQYWHVLRYYKDHHLAEVRTQLATILSATIARFTYRHWSCVAMMLGGAPTVVTTVPSTRLAARPGEHPLVAAVRRSSLLAGFHRTLLTRGPGQVGHQQASDDAFLVHSDLHDHRVLLIEDTFTSGARTQSAASALRVAGASAVAVVSAGRVIDPRWNENCERIWQYACAVEFSFESCAVCTLRT